VEQIYEILLPLPDKTKIKVYAFLSIRKYLEKDTRYQIFIEMFNSLNPTTTLQSYLPTIDNVVDKQLYESVFYVLDFV